MRILFIHQNCPGQFKHLAPRLASMPGNEVTFITRPGKPDVPGVHWDKCTIKKVLIDYVIKLIKRLVFELAIPRGLAAGIGAGRMEHGANLFNERIGLIRVW